jgi:hypothetical protein
MQKNSSQQNIPLEIVKFISRIGFFFSTLTFFPIQFEFFLFFYFFKFCELTEISALLNLLAAGNLALEIFHFSLNEFLASSKNNQRFFFSIFNFKISTTLFRLAWQKITSKISLKILKNQNNF